MTAPALLTKAEIRKHMLAKRDELDELMRIAYARLIRNAATELIESLGLRSVHCYLSYRSEVSTTGIIADMLENKISVYVPVVRRNDGKEVMQHALLRDPEHLTIGAYGIPEPKNGEIVERPELEAVILPVAAFDGFGNRLGYGKGFYDRFLAGVPASVKRIGLAYSLQEVDTLPVESFDERLDMIVTEQGITFASEQA